MPGTVVIVGASVGGVRTAQALRREGHVGPIVLVGAEPDLPYDKPPLSKQFLAGTWDVTRVSLMTAEQAAAADVELCLGVAAARLDVPGRAVMLADASRIGYDVVVVATGAAARPSPWQPASGVHVIRTLDDSRRLRESLTAHDGPVVVVGGGFIGAEVAGTAHAAGREVTVVDPEQAPIARILGAEIGTLFGTVHEKHGVANRFGTGVRDITGRAGDLQVALTDGSVLPAAIVVVGIGAVPNTGWLESSGLLVGDGLICDEFCRAVGRHDVYAVGDAARWYHAGHDDHVRAEHWTNAVEQAACVAHNITNPGAPRAHVPDEYVWSDQYDWKIQIVGRPDAGTVYQLYGDPEATPPRFAVVYGDQDGRFVGAATVNWPKASLTCRRALAARPGAEEVGAQVAVMIGPARGPASGSVAS